MILAAFVFIQIHGDTAKVAQNLHAVGSGHEVAMDTTPDPWF